MNVQGKRFEVDRANGKIAGVCAGIANMTGVDATILRVGLVLVAIFGSFWILAVYAAAAVIGQPRRSQSTALSRTPGGEDARARMRSLDVRMQAIETYVTSSNSKLAREIEDLRKD